MIWRRANRVIAAALLACSRPSYWYSQSGGSFLGLKTACSKLRNSSAPHTSSLPLFLCWDAEGSNSSISSETFVQSDAVRICAFANNKSTSLPGIKLSKSQIKIGTDLFDQTLSKFTAGGLPLAIAISDRSEDRSEDRSVQFNLGVVKLW